MEWTKLELRKAAVLRKEVDLAIRNVSTAVENDNQNQVDDLMESIQFRIDQIEEFYAQNDNDERAILFEKQRLRLRRTLQNLAPPPPTAAPPMPHVTVTTPESSPQKNGHQVEVVTSPSRQQKITRSNTTTNSPHDPISRQQKFALRKSSMGSPPTGFNSSSNLNSTQQRSPQRSPPRDEMTRMHLGELENFSEDDDHSGISSQFTNQSNKKNKNKKKMTSKLPTYSWETTGEENHTKNAGNGVAQERIFTAEHGAFIPSTTPGLYMAEEEGDDSSTVASEVTDNLKSINDYPSTHLDIQVVLTPAEFEAYVLRKRNVTKKTSGSKNAVLIGKTAKDNSKYSSYLTKQGSYLNTQTPYMDPKRVKLDLCRPRQVDKWMHPKGFL